MEMRLQTNSSDPSYCGGWISLILKSLKSILSMLSHGIFNTLNKKFNS